jgi:hypothetical protein
VVADRPGVADRLGVDELAEGVRPCPGSRDRRGARPPAAGTSRSGRRPCAAARWNGGSAARSPRWWPGGSVAEQRADAPERLVAGRRLGHVGLDRGVAVRRRACQLGLDRGSERRLVGDAHGRVAGRRRPCRLERGDHGAGVGLGLLDVGLVERLDAQDDAGQRGRDLPAHELGADLDLRADVDADDRMAGRGQLHQASVDVRADGRIGTGRTGERDADEDAVVAVRAGRRAARRPPEPRRRRRPGSGWRRAATLRYWPPCRCSRR